MKMKRLMAALCAIGTVFALGLPVSADEGGSTVADITFRPGELLLEKISSFSFGTQDIVPTAAAYPAVESRVYLTVRDLRGSGEGWRITAVGSPFNGAANTLPGAYLVFSGGIVVPEIEDSTSPAVEQDIRLDMDGTTSTDIAVALPGAGLGNWSMEWTGPEGDNAAVTLHLPGGVGTATNHTATITWTLKNAP